MLAPEECLTRTEKDTHYFSNEHIRKIDTNLESCPWEFDRQSCEISFAIQSALSFQCLKEVISDYQILGWNIEHITSDGKAIQYENPEEEMERSEIDHYTFKFSRPDDLLDIEEEEDDVLCATIVKPAPCTPFELLDQEGYREATKNETLAREIIDYIQNLPEKGIQIDILKEVESYNSFEAIVPVSFFAGFNIQEFMKWYNHRCQNNQSSTLTKNRDYIVTIMLSRIIEFRGIELDESHYILSFKA